MHGYLGRAVGNRSSGFSFLVGGGSKGEEDEGREEVGQHDALHLARAARLAVESVFGRGELCKERK